MKKSKIIEDHICGYNDGDCVCECFVSGMEAIKAELLEKAKEYQEKIRGGGNGRRIMEEFINSNLLNNN